jgi:hypothetical protein
MMPPIARLRAPEDLTDGFPPAMIAEGALQKHHEGTALLK